MWSCSTLVTMATSSGLDADVVEELGLLVPVDGVVLVALDDERRARPAIGPHAASSRMARARRQALGDAADEPARLEARLARGARRTSRSSSSCRACPRRRAARRRARKCSRSAPDIDVARQAQALGAPAPPGSSRRIALPTTTRSGARRRGARRRSPAGSGRPSARSVGPMGGSNATSEPLTSCPASRRAPRARPCPCRRRRPGERASPPVSPSRRRTRRRSRSTFTTLPGG